MDLTIYFKIYKQRVDYQVVNKYNKFIKPR